MQDLDVAQSNVANLTAQLVPQRTSGVRPCPYSGGAITRQLCQRCSLCAWHGRSLWAELGNITWRQKRLQLAVMKL